MQALFGEYMFMHYSNHYLIELLPLELHIEGRRPKRPELAKAIEHAKKEGATLIVYKTRSSFFTLRSRSPRIIQVPAMSLDMHWVFVSSLAVCLFAFKSNGVCVCVFVCGVRVCQPSLEMHFPRYRASPLSACEQPT